MPRIYILCSVSVYHDDIPLQFNWTLLKYNHFQNIDYIRFQFMSCLMHQGPFNVSKTKGKHITAQRNKVQWNKVEFVKYAVFLEYFQAEFIEREERNGDGWGIFVGMSSFLVSRNPNQCRIFHNFKMRHQKNLFYLIESCRRIIDRYEQFYEHYSFELSCSPLNKCRENKTGSQKVIVLFQDQHSCSQTIRSESDSCPKRDQLKATDTEYFDHFGSSFVPHQKDQDYFTDKPFIQGQNNYPKLQQVPLEAIENEWVDIHLSFMHWTEKYNLLMAADHSE